jgi:hypothetical protein
MTPRDTRTGGVLETMVLPALKMGGYSVQIQAPMGCRPGGRKHKVDVLAEKDARKLLISLKWQQVGGTAEQKVPFEVICLMDAVKEHKLAKSYLVLGGAGWTLRDFYVGGGLKSYLKYAELVDILTLEQFVAAANKGKL